MATRFLLLLLLFPVAAFAIDFVGIRVEIDTDPLGRGYSGMTDAEVADDMNTYYRPARNGTAMMLNYLIITRSRTNTGDDTERLPILGRLQMMAEASVGDDVFGTGIVANRATHEMIAWAKTFNTVVASSHLGTIDYIDTELDSGYVALGPGLGIVWKQPDIDALRAFSQNQQSRGQELGFGNVRTGWVTKARALP